MQSFWIVKPNGIDNRKKTKQIKVTRLPLYFYPFLMAKTYKNLFAQITYIENLYGVPVAASHGKAVGTQTTAKIDFLRKYLFPLSKWREGRV